MCMLKWYYIFTFDMAIVSLIAELATACIVGSPIGAHCTVFTWQRRTGTYKIVMCTYYTIICNIIFAKMEIKSKLQFCSCLSV